jgi:hypothetical protein
MKEERGVRLGYKEERVGNGKTNPRRVVLPLKGDWDGFLR